MERKRYRHLVKFMSIILAISLLVPIGAQAATLETVSPRASDYLAAYTAYICAMGGGDLEIWFEVTGTDYWADIGVLTIYLYESTDNSNFYWVDTFHFSDYPNMLWHNDFACVDNVVEWDNSAVRLCTDCFVTDCGVNGICKVNHTRTRR